MFEFEWDESKAKSNLRKHEISFDLARTIFHDPRLLTVADTEHNETDERWFSLGAAANGAILCTVYLWKETTAGLTRIRLISARRATRNEIGYYQEGL